MEKFLKMIFAVVIVAVAGYGIYTSQKSEVLSDLLLSNMDALADDGEGGITCSRSCSDGVGQCYKKYDQWGNCHFSGYQSDHCTC